MIKANLIYKYFIMKNLKNLGKALNKAEQKMINGGKGGNCPSGTCSNFYICVSGVDDCIISVHGTTCYGTHNGSICCV